MFAIATSLGDLPSFNRVYTLVWETSAKRVVCERNSNNLWDMKEQYDDDGFGFMSHNVDEDTIFTHLADALLDYPVTAYYH